MESHQLIEIAAIVAGQTPVMLRSAMRVSDASLEQYWVAAKCRLDRWGRMLKQYSDRMQEPAAPRSLLWNSARPLLEEILASEILTRVWTALGCAMDERRHSRDIGPIARSIYLGHLEARNRVLNMMLRGQGFGVEAAVTLNRLRHRLERWTDMLLGYIQTATDATEFAFDAERVREFAADIEHEQQYPGGQVAWQVVLASLRAAFRRSLACDPLNDDLHERIAAAILACFDPEVFDSTGALKSLWLVRLSNVAQDTQGMIASLLAEEGPPAVRPATLPHRRF
jgi:hypothetical protein